MARSRILSPPPRRRQADFSLATVNIVLLLVFFFLITGSMVQTGEADVDLARTSELPLERLPRPLLLIDENGNEALDGTPLAAGELGPALAEQSAGVLYVLADRDLPADRLLGLLQRPELAGIGLQLVTLHTRGASQ
jgi:biopolymer transport protein ExbD